MDLPLLLVTDEHFFLQVFIPPRDTLLNILSGNHWALV